MRIGFLTPTPDASQPTSGEIAARSEPEASSRLFSKNCLIKKSSLKSERM
jgi:hypothetical protein